MPWKCFAPFEADAEAVLAKAREEAFRSGAYGKPYARGEPRVPSIGALIEACAEDGTCSIIDVTGIGDRPEVGSAGPFSAAVLREALGTVRPTRDVADKERGALYEHLGRGEAAYVVCYADGAPAEVMFLGYSYD